MFWHEERQLISPVHGDDFTTAGPKDSLDWFKAQLERKDQNSDNMSQMIKIAEC